MQVLERRSGQVKLMEDVQAVMALLVPLVRARLVVDRPLRAPVVAMRTHP